MSNQSSQRVRRMASPSMMKQQGPLKATKSFGLKTISPSASPTQWGSESNHRSKQRSPDHLRGSPNSPGVKDKNKPIRYSPVHVSTSSIKRTGSFDTIAGPYLKGEWPRGEQFVIPTVPQQQQVSYDKYHDQSTQTPEEWEEQDKKKHKRSSSLGTGENMKEVRVIKARLAKSKEGSKVMWCVQRSSPLQGNHHAVTSSNIQTTKTAMTGTVPVSIPYIPAKSTGTRTRGSVEGLNQEIEKLVLKSHSGIDNEDHTQEPTPDGHRAPVMELLAVGPETRNADTQTPSGPTIESSLREEQESCHSSSESESTNTSPSSLQSESPTHPIIPVPGSHDSPRVPSLEYTTGKDYTIDSQDKEREEESPNLNKLFVREPPDGCEKVKMVEESRRLSSEMQESLLTFPVIKKPLETCRIPSKSSAFCPLFKPYASQPELVIHKPTATTSTTNNISSPKEKEFLSGSSPVLDIH